MRGTVKWFNDDKGFGFITPDDSGPELFVHYSAVKMQGRRTLTQGQPVEYEVTDNGKGPRAAEVLPDP